MAGRIRVAIADDQKDFRLLIRLTLARHGRFEVVGECDNGAEAVALANAEKPDAILLDLAMPVMDGLKALPLIRAGSPATKVLVISAFEGNYGIDAALKLGAHDFLVKGASTASDVVPKLLRLCGPATTGA